jgi:hypothetical protein
VRTFVIYTERVKLEAFGTASGQYELLRPKVKSLKTKFWLWSEYITEHLNGLNVKLLGTKNLMASLRDNIKSSSDKTSVLVNANKESKFITFELGKLFNLSESCVRLNCYPENNGLLRTEF